MEAAVGRRGVCPGRRQGGVVWLRCRHRSCPKKQKQNRDCHFNEAKLFFMTKQPRTPLDDDAPTSPPPHLPSSPIPFPPVQPALLPTASPRLTRGRQLTVKQIMATEHWQWEVRGGGGSDRCTLEKEWKRWEGRRRRSCRQRGRLRLRHSSVKIPFTGTLPTTRAAQATPPPPRLSLSHSFFLFLPVFLPCLPLTPPPCTLST